MMYFLYLLNPLHIKQHLKDLDDNYEETLLLWLGEIPQISTTTSEGKV